MKKKLSVILSLIMVLGVSGILTGCGTDLDREVNVQGMNVEVPSEWAETVADGNSEEKGVLYYEEKSDDMGDDETANKIIIQYETLDMSEYKTAAEAIEALRLDLEEEYGITYWNIADEDLTIADGAQVSLYEYSFIKEINNIKEKYEGRIIYVYSANMCYTIEVCGDEVDAAKLVKSIEF